MSGKFCADFHFFFSLLHKILAITKQFFPSSSQAIYFSHRLKLLVLFRSYNSVAPSRFLYFPSRIFLWHMSFSAGNFPGQPNNIRRFFGSHKKRLRATHSQYFGESEETTCISVGYNPLILPRIICKQYELKKVGCFHIFQNGAFFRGSCWKYASNWHQLKGKCSHPAKFPVKFYLIYKFWRLYCLAQKFWTATNWLSLNWR